MRAVFMQECVEQGLFDVKFIKGKNNVADLLTKWLAKNEFVKHRNKLVNLKAQRRAGTYKGPTEGLWL